MSTTQSTTATIGRVMVPVTDQDKAIEFYTQNFGFEVKSDVPFGNGDRWVEIGPAGEGATHLALVNPPEGREDGPGINTNIALDVDDVEATHSSLRDAGVDVDAEVMKMGDPVPPMFWMRDQDGNTLLVVEPQAA